MVHTIDDNEIKDEIAASYQYYALGILIIAVSLGIRFFSYPVVTADYTASLSHWMDALRGSPGLTAFANPFSDYAPLYLYILKILTLIPVKALYAIKTVSFIFDIVLAYIGYRIVKYVLPDIYNSGTFFCIFAVLISIPTLILNSSLWAQSDALYAVFVLLSLYLLLRDKPIGSTLAWAVAFSFKLQAVFFLPVLIGYLFTKKNGLAKLFIVPGIFILTIIPAWLSGGSFFQLLTVYGAQSGEFKELTLYAPTLFAFINDSAMSDAFRTVLSTAGVLLAIVMACGMIVLVARVICMRSTHAGDRTAVSRAAFSPNRILFLTLLSVLVLPFVLPHMHERYFYLADILSVIYAFSNPRRWYVAVMIVLASFFSYMPFLSGSVPFFGHLIVNLVVPAALILVVIVSMIPKAGEMWRGS